MKDVVFCIEQLRLKLDKHRKEDLKELPTRRIFIDPLLEALGWDVTDHDEVQLEYSTIDGKSVDYALKLNGKPVLYVEAKPLHDELTDVKAITQIVNYANNDGIVWCILTNGITYKVYRSTEKAEAPEKLLFEVSIDLKESEGKSVQQIAEQLNRFSRDDMAQGKLDEIGEQVFTTSKIRKALDKLFIDPPNQLVKLIRSTVGDESIRPTQVKEALKRLCYQTSEVAAPVTASAASTSTAFEQTISSSKRGLEYGEEYHLKGKPQEVSELYKSIDKFCRELNPGNIKKQHLKMYIRYAYKKAFCNIYIQKGGLRIWLKLKYSQLKEPPDYVRDVSNIGHFGPGDVEIDLDGFGQLQTAKSLIRLSYEINNR